MNTITIYTNVYLAGNLREGWRWYVKDNTKDLPIRFFSPLEIPKTDPYYGPNTMLDSTYKITDLAKVDRSDLIFAYICVDPMTRYAGTSFEIGWAKKDKKRIILVNNLEGVDYDKYRFIMYQADFNCGTLDKGIDVLRKIVMDMLYEPGKSEPEPEPEWDDSEWPEVLFGQTPNFWGDSE